MFKNAPPREAKEKAFLSLPGPTPVDRKASKMERYQKDAEISRNVLVDVGLPITCVPHNMRFIGVQEMWDQFHESEKGNQTIPLNYFVYMEGCPWCRSAFPEYLGAAWIVACRENDGPFHVVSSATLTKRLAEEGFREKLDVKTFPSLRCVRPGGEVLKFSGERTVANMIGFFDRRPPSSHHRGPGLAATSSRGQTE